MGRPLSFYSGVGSATLNILSTNYPQGAFTLHMDLSRWGSKGGPKVTCRNRLAQFYLLVTTLPRLP